MMVTHEQGGIQNVLQQSQVGYSAPVQYGAPVGAALPVRKLDIHRTTEELSTLNSQIRLRFPFSVPGSLVLPETFSIDNLNAYINVFMATDTLRTSQLFEDFAVINYKDCFEVKWPKDMTTLPTVSEARLPRFRPAPPKPQSREEVYLGDETSFECWLYVNSWHSQLIDSVMDAVRKDTESCDHLQSFQLYHSLSDELDQEWERFRS